MTDKKLVSKAIRLAYENPTLRGELLPTIKYALEFSTNEQMEAYLKEHPKADPRNHKVVKKSISKVNPELAKKAEGLSPKAKKAVSTMFNSANKSVSKFVSDPKARKEMCKGAPKSLGSYIKGTFVGEDENGKMSLKKGAIAKSIGEEIHHVSDFSKGLSTLTKSALGGEVSDEDKKKAKSQLKHSAWGVGVLCGKVLLAGVAAASATGVVAVAAYAGKKFAMKLGLHLAIASLTRSGMVANLVGTGQLGLALGEGAMSMLASEKDNDSYSAKYGKGASDEDKLGLLAFDMTSNMAKVLEEGISDDDLLKIIEETATGSDEEEISDSDLDLIVESFTKELKKTSTPQKKASYAELDVFFV